MLRFGTDFSQAFKFFDELCMPVKLNLIGKAWRSKIKAVFALLGKLAGFYSRLASDVW